MKHRWVDVTTAYDSDEDPTSYVGGCGPADLWLVHTTNVLICQYQDNDDYVSYYPAATVWDDAKGTLNAEVVHKYNGVAVSEFPKGLRTKWGARIYSLIQHNPKDIATYLAVFCPDVFTDTERAEILNG